MVSCSSPLLGRVNAPPEISNLEFAIQPNEQVLRLEVAVDHVLGMQVRKAIGHLAGVLGRESAILIDCDSLYGAMDTHLCTPALAKPAELGQLLEQLALACKLEHEVEVLLIGKVVVQAHNVWVSGDRILVSAEH